MAGNIPLHYPNLTAMPFDELVRHLAATIHNEYSASNSCDTWLRYNPKGANAVVREHLALIVALLKVVYRGNTMAGRPVSPHWSAVERLLRTVIERTAALVELAVTRSEAAVETTVRAVDATPLPRATQSSRRAAAGSVFGNTVRDDGDDSASASRASNDSVAASEDGNGSVAASDDDDGDDSASASGACDDSVAASEDT